MHGMSEPFHQLLEATIQYLQDLKAGGGQFIAVSPEALRELCQPAGRPLASRSAGSAPPQSSSRPALSVAPRAAKSSETIALSPALARPGEGSELPSPLGPEARREAMAQLRERAMACVLCPSLASSRKNVVFGVGDIHAPVLFIGEAPGADEDEQGEPFVGKAGQLLTRIIQTMGFSRETVYIANLLKCRPDTPGQASGNRKPTPEEMKTCLPYLHGQIDLIQPKVIVALGATAVEGLLGKTIGISRLRGQWQTYRSIPLMPTYHPAYLLRNQAMSEKRRVWEDMLQVLERLGLPISEKQRGYFLNG